MALAGPDGFSRSRPCHRDQDAAPLIRSVDLAPQLVSKEFNPESTRSSSPSARHSRQIDASPAQEVSLAAAPYAVKTQTSYFAFSKPTRLLDFIASRVTLA